MFLCARHCSVRALSFGEAVAEGCIALFMWRKTFAGWLIVRFRVFHVHFVKPRICLQWPCFGKPFSFILMMKNQKRSSCQPLKDLVKSIEVKQEVVANLATALATSAEAESPLYHLICSVTRASSGTCQVRLGKTHRNFDLKLRRRLFQLLRDRVKNSGKLTSC